MVASFAVSFEWPAAQATLLSAVSCLFDASSVMFALLKLAYVADPVTFSRRNLFLGYAVGLVRSIVLLLIVVGACCLHCTALHSTALHWR